YLLRETLVAREPVVNKDVFNVVLGALVTAFTTVVAYYFGSSSASLSKKDDASGQPMTLPQGSATSEAPPRTTSDLTAPLLTGPGVSTVPKRQPAAPTPTGELGVFRQKAPGIIRALMGDLSLTEVQAAGILGNIGHECAGFRLLQEQRPLRGGRGGWGWCQWTGTRRTDFENWASEKGLDYSSYEANYGFLLTELRGTQADSVRRIREAQSVETATTDFMNTFERPAAQYAGLSNRIRLAQLALQDFRRVYNVYSA
ncbi:MAG: phage tail tip lysozyme, partial [Xanthobacteraceae bacterium]